jgi:hypothetical protein
LRGALSLPPCHRQQWHGGKAAGICQHPSPSLPTCRTGGQASISDASLRPRTVSPLRQEIVRAPLSHLVGLIRPVEVPHSVGGEDDCNEG